MKTISSNQWGKRNRIYITEGGLVLKCAGTGSKVVSASFKQAYDVSSGKLWIFEILNKKQTARGTQ